MSRTVILISLFFNFLVQGLQGQESVEISTITPRDGLSYRWVFDIMEDHHGLIWISTFDGLNRYDGKRFKVFKHSATDTNSISNNHVRSTVEAPDGKVWITTDVQIPDLYDPKTNKFIHFKTDLNNPQAITNEHIISETIFIDDLKNEWLIFSGNNGKIFWQRYLGEGKFSSVIYGDLQIHDIAYISDAGNGNLWIWGDNRGHFSINMKTGVTKLFEIPNVKSNGNKFMPWDENNRFWYPQTTDGGNFELSSFKMPDIGSVRWANYYVDNDENIWLRDELNRAYLFDKMKNEVDFYATIVDNNYDGGLGSNTREISFMFDSEHTLWAGHFFGITKVKKPELLFRNYMTSQQMRQSGIQSNVISARNIIEGPNETIYLRSQTRKIFEINKATGQIEMPPFGSTTCIFTDGDGIIWMTNSSTLTSLDPESRVRHKYNLPSIVNSEVIWYICEDAQNRLWLGGNHAYYLFDKHKESFIVPEDYQNNLMSYCSSDMVNNIIWSSYEKGLLKINCKDGSLQYFELFPEARNEGEIISILVKNDHLWLGTYLGLIRFDIKTNQHIVYTTEDGLPHNIIYSILESGDDLWLGTHFGLCRFNQTTRDIMTFYEDQGLSNNEFNRSSYLKAKDGTLFFGGLNGINAFHPNDLKSYKRNSRPFHLTDILKYPFKTDTIITVFIDLTASPSNLSLGANENSIRIEYAIASHTDPLQNQYFHYLEGLEQGWISDGNVASIRYNRIPPGNYTFHAKALDPSGSSALNEIEFSVFVSQVWYLRWWALMIYGLLVVNLIYIGYKFLIKRRLEKEEAMRLRELDGLKTKLYTNITHEFRTPLTVIQGMNASVQKYFEDGDKSGIRNATVMIQRNSQNLLNLINEMLDLSKLESGALTLNLIHGDINKYVESILESFQALALNKNITLHFLSGEDSIFMDFDKDKMLYIVSNLISNAIKFTPEGGNIYFQLNAHDKSTLEMKVKDTGIGIPPEKLSFIFDRFYQVEDGHTRSGEGSGIGLALVKELTKIMGGNISVKSELDKGSVFKVTLPISHKAEIQLADLQIVTPLVVDKSLLSLDALDEVNALDEDTPIVLLVEDNEDVLHYLKVCIGEQYRVCTAIDGQLGTDVAFDIIPDIIVSDVMMPNRDGFEFCKMIKNDIRTSHIPVILLTAKADVDARIEGLQQGADAYIAKPFNQEELLVQMKNLMDLRNKMQQYYASMDLSSNIPNIKESKEDVFIQNVKSLVIENLTNDDFGIPMLCKLLLLGRTQLHKKLKALSGLSASHFIRKIRLEKAHELLKTTDLNVSEVCYEVGFSNRSHFSRVFITEFGVSPRDIRHTGKNKMGS